jgi:hypothetical protein
MESEKHDGGEEKLRVEVERHQPSAWSWSTLNTVKKGAPFKRISGAKWFGRLLPKIATSAHFCALSPEKTVATSHENHWLKSLILKNRGFATAFS